jgi:hypothetical protein
VSRTADYRDQHAALVRLIGEIQSGLVDLDDRGAAATRSALNTLSGKLTVHLSMEDQGLYPRLKSHEDLRIRDLAARFDAEMSGLKDAFSAFNGRWTRQEIAANPEEFRRAFAKISSALGERIRRENTELYAAFDAAA